MMVLVVLLVLVLAACARRRRAIERLWTPTDDVLSQWPEPDDEWIGPS